MTVRDGRIVMAATKGKQPPAEEKKPATEAVKPENKDWIESLPTMEELLKRDTIRIDAFMRSGFTESQITESMESRSKMVQEFFAQNVEFLETKDKEVMEKTSSMIHGLGTKCLVTSLVGNLLLGPMTDERIYSLPKYYRYIMRVIIVAAPLTYAFNYGWNRYQRVSLYLEDKYADRIVTFFKTHDPAAVNPELKRSNKRR